MPNSRLEFRHRAHEVSRVEAFSDVIFGFAMTLLVVSLEAPKSYEELMEMMRGMLPFTFCFLIFMDIWFKHHNFFKRYALHDRVVLALNTALLFVILFYVYPLKYMFTVMSQQLTGRWHGGHVGEARVLFAIYGVGFAAVFWIFAAMYARAWAKRDELELSEYERSVTKECVIDNAVTGVFGVLSAILGFLVPPLAGLIYFGLCIPKTIIPWVFGAKRRHLEVAAT